MQAGQQTHDAAAKTSNMLPEQPSAGYASPTAPHGQDATSATQVAAHHQPAHHTRSAADAPTYPTAPHGQDPTAATQPSGYQAAPGIKTTHEKTGIQATQSGAAAYVGGAPLPGRPIDKQTPDVIHKQREAETVEQAQLNKRQAEEEREMKKDGKMTDKMKSMMHVAQAKLAATSAEKHQKKDEKKVVKSHEVHAKRFHSLFPDCHEEVIAMFKCKYIDGKSETSKGFLIVTNTHVRYAGDVGDPTRETIPYKSIASIEDVGRPARINVYTVERRVYQFTDIATSQDGIEDDSPHTAAMNWIDHMWREVAQVPNPAATYFSS